MAIDAARDEMLARIRDALGRPGAARAEPLPRFAGGAGQPVGDAERFRLEVKNVGGQVASARSRVEVEAYLSGVISRTGTTSVAVTDGFSRRHPGIGSWLSGRGFAVVPSLSEFGLPSSEPHETSDREGSPTTRPEQPTPMDSYKRALFEAGIGLTLADYALADTGTLVLVSGNEQHRMISLVPPVHICLLDAKCILSDLTVLMDEIGAKRYRTGEPPRAMTFITGPSRTADIELTLTLGVHGPGELHVLIDDSTEREADPARG